LFKLGKKIQTLVTYSNDVIYVYFLILEARFAYGTPISKLIRWYDIIEKQEQIQTTTCVHDYEVKISEMTQT